MAIGFTRESVIGIRREWVIGIEENPQRMKTDAKGQQIVYTYDSLKRLTTTQY
jgi:hypothetical protein